MAKKKNSIKTFWRKTFGKKLTISDFLLIAIIVAFPIYKIWTGDLKQLIEDFAGYIWAGIVVAYVVTILIRRARR